MPASRIIVIGGSAGSLKALTTIASGLPESLDAAVFVVQHLRPNAPTLLAQIVSDISRLPASHPGDQEPILRGRIYIAPPDHHLLLDRGFMRVVRGPRENLHRPSIDALFRSAARSYGTAVIGVVLSGMLDDGTIGLQAVKRRGGITVIQDPAEAEYPSMPRSALRHATIDYSLPLAAIAGLLVDLVGKPSAAEGDRSITVDVEADIALQMMDSRQLLASTESIGSRSPYTCPTCNGTLWQVGNDEPLRFRCHVGHAFTAPSLLAEQTRSLENALWSALRLMEEKAGFARRMAERRRQAGLAEAAETYADYAQRIERDIALLRRLLLDGTATDYVADDAEARKD